VSNSTVKLENDKTNIVKKGSILNSKKVVPYIFVSPFIISFLLFFLYPIISTINMSFQEILGPGEAKYIGLKYFLYIYYTAKITLVNYYILLQTPSG
jgi:arabinosaccharide transport system permease protein